MTTYTVSTEADLLKYTASASNGDTILVKPGTYSGIILQNIAKTGNVTITSADPLHPAVLMDLLIRNCQGLTISNFDMYATKDMPFQVTSGSQRITIDQVDVHGTLNGTSSDDVRGMIVRDSTNITVSNSHFHELTAALGFSNGQYVTFANNRFELIRDDGISGGGASNLTITGNVFTDFDHVGAIHPDAIQIWTSNTTTAASDIAISNNVFSRGNGAVVQGIFVTDQVGLPYKNLSITNNVVIGAMYNGVWVDGADNVTMTDNVVIGAQDQASWLGVRNVKSATIMDNIASSYNFSYANGVNSGDVLATTVTMADLAALSSQLSAIAIAGQLGTVPGLFEAMVLSDVSQLGYFDTPPSGSTGGGGSGGGSSSGTGFSVTQVDGTAGNDTLHVGSVGDYHLYGYAGNDTLVGGKGGSSNVLEGGTGDDGYTIYQASDTIIENPNGGNDTVYTYFSYTLADNVEIGRAMVNGLTLYGNSSDNTLQAATGGSTLYGADGNDTVIGNGGDDVLYGDNGNDRLLGNGGNDILDGGSGDDMLYGNAGDDILRGGTGNDRLEGGSGKDILSGGTGADVFTFRGGDFTSNVAASMDTITDFKASEGDILDVSPIDAKSGTTADDKFTFIGTQAFHKIAGELRYAPDTDGITVYGDTTGNGVADFAIHLSGVTSLLASNITL